MTQLLISLAVPGILHADMSTSSPVHDDKATLKEATANSVRAATFWANQIKLADREEREWRKRAKELVARYRSEKSQADSGTRFPILWANTELLKPAVFSSTPAPDVRRRNLREDQMQQATGRQVAALIERALAFSIDDQPFDEAMEHVRDDMLLVGRGAARLAYVPDIVRRDDVQQSLDPDTGAVEYFLDGLPADPEFDSKDRPFVDQLVDERVEVRPVFWGDMRFAPARNWTDTWWVAFRHAMTKDQMTEEFGKELAGQIPLTIGAEPTSAEMTENQPVDPKAAFHRAELWEVWNRNDREVVWIATGFDKVVRVDADPLGLREFYPMPAPLLSIVTTDTTVPLPEFVIYQNQADELDEIEDRIRRLIEILKAIVLCSGDFTEVLKIRDAKDGAVIPVKREGLPAGELANDLFSWPVERYVQVIDSLTRRAAQVKASIYELTGLSDLLRGATKERETAAAQKLKGQFGQARMSPRSIPMARYVRDVLRLKAEIMSERFQPETLSRIGGVPVTPQMVELLQTEHLRNTLIEVATDSTIRPDKAAEKEEAVEFMGAVTGYLTAAGPIVAQAPFMAPLLLEMLKQASKAFRFGRNFEEMIEELADQASMAAAQGAPGGVGAPGVPSLPGQSVPPTGAPVPGNGMVPGAIQ